MSESNTIEVLSLFKGVMKIRCDPRPEGGLNTILRETALDHGFAPEDLKRRDRKVKIAHARHDFMWRARQVKWSDGERRYSSTMIGIFLGAMDHTSVLYGAAAHEARAAGRKLNRKAGLSRKDRRPAAMRFAAE